MTAPARLLPILPLAALAGARVPRLPGSFRPGSPAQLVAAAAVTLAVIGGLGWLGEASEPELPAETTVVRVGAGETVWDVARRVAPESDPQDVIERIRQLNGMTGPAVQPGQPLRVPDGR